MSYGRSRFYNNIYVPFRDGRYDDALNADGIKAALAEIRRDLGTEKAVREVEALEALELALNAVLAYQIVLP